MCSVTGDKVISASLIVASVAVCSVLSPSNCVLSYFVIGSMGVLSASVAKLSVTEFLGTMSVSVDVLALAKVGVELVSIPEGKNAIIRWRGKPVFIFYLSLIP